MTPALRPQEEMVAFQPPISGIKENISGLLGIVHREDIGSYITYLNHQKDVLKNELNSKSRSRNLYTPASIILSAVSFLIFLFFEKLPLTAPPSFKYMFLLFVPYFLFFALYSFSRYPTATLESEIRDIDEQIELIRCIEENHEIRAERRFRHHEYELKRYYDQTLNQSAKIFYVGVFSIISGLILIFIFSYWVTLEGNDKIILGFLGAIGSILSNYIAVIYGRMYKDTIQSLNQFHNRLVTTHHLHYGALLSSQIRDNDLIDQTLSQMAINTSTLEPLSETKEKSSGDDQIRPELT
jgi:amino acid permease